MHRQRTGGFTPGTTTANVRRQSPNGAITEPRRRPHQPAPIGAFRAPASSPRKAGAPPCAVAPIGQRHDDRRLPGAPSPADARRGMRNAHAPGRQIAPPRRTPADITDRATPPACQISLDGRRGHQPRAPPDEALLLRLAPPPRAGAATAAANPSGHCLAVVPYVRSSHSRSVSPVHLLAQISRGNPGKFAEFSGRGQRPHPARRSQRDVVVFLPGPCAPSCAGWRRPG